MNEPPVLPSQYCNACGAAIPAYSTECWLCSNSNPYASQGSSGFNPNSQSMSPAQRRTQQICLVMLVGCTLLAVLIGIGIASQDAAMLIPFFIIIGPAFLATGVRALHSYHKKGRPKPSELFLTFLWSGLFTLVTLVLLTIASVIAFLIWCFAMISR